VRSAPKQENSTVIDLRPCCEDSLREEIAVLEGQRVVAQEVCQGVVGITEKFRLESMVAQDAIDRHSGNALVFQSIEIPLDPADPERVNLRSLSTGSWMSSGFVSAQRNEARDMHASPTSCQ